MSDTAEKWQVAATGVDSAALIGSGGVNSGSPERVVAALRDMMESVGNPFRDLLTRAEWRVPSEAARVLIVGGVHTRGSRWTGGHVKALLERTEGAPSFVEEKLMLESFFNACDPRMPPGTTAALRLVPYAPTDTWKMGPPAFVVETLAVFLYAFISACRGIRAVVASDKTGARALAYIAELPADAARRVATLRNSLATVDDEGKTDIAPLRMWEVRRMAFGARQVLLTRAVGWNAAEEVFVGHDASMLRSCMELCCGVPRFLEESATATFLGARRTRWDKLLGGRLWAAEAPERGETNRIIDGGRLGVFHGPLMGVRFDKAHNPKGTKGVRRETRVIGTDSWQPADVALTPEKLASYLELIVQWLARPGPNPRVVVGTSTPLGAELICACLEIYIDPRTTPRDACAARTNAFQGACAFRDVFGGRSGEFFGGAAGRTQLTHGVMRVRDGRRVSVGRFPNEAHARAFVILEEARGAPAGELVVCPADELLAAEADEAAPSKRGRTGVQCD